MDFVKSCYDLRMKNWFTAIYYFNHTVTSWNVTFARGKASNYTGCCMVGLSFWSLGDMAAISDVEFSNILVIDILSISCEIPSEYHMTPYMISISALVRMQAITWIIVDQDSWWHQALLDLTWWTHWGRDKMATIFQTTFPNAFSWMKMYGIQLKISLKIVPKGPINNIPGLVHIMAWRRTGDKPLS